MPRKYVRHPIIDGESVADRKRRLATNRMRAWNRARGAKARTKMPIDVYKAKRLTSYKAWRAKNIEHARKYARDAQNKDPARTLAHATNQKHKRRSATRIGGVSRLEWSDILESFGHRCAYCLRTFTKLEIDHVTALSKGGEHVAANVIPACRSCNARKSNRGILKMLKEAA